MEFGFHSLLAAFGGLRGLACGVGVACLKYSTIWFWVSKPKAMSVICEFFCFVLVSQGNMFIWFAGESIIKHVNGMFN